MLDLTHFPFNPLGEDHEEGGKTLLVFQKRADPKNPDSPEDRARQRVLLDGEPKAATMEFLATAKTTLLHCGAMMTIVYLDGPAGSMMFGPGLNENIQQLAVKAKTYAREFGATRVLGHGASWLVPKQLPGKRESETWRKARRRGRKSALYAFCADKEKGVFIAYAQVVENRKGRPVGFCSVEPHLCPEYPNQVLVAEVGQGLYAKEIPALARSVAEAVEAAQAGRVGRMIAGHKLVIPQLATAG